MKSIIKYIKKLIKTETKFDVIDVTFVKKEMVADIEIFVFTVLIDNTETPELWIAVGDIRTYWVSKEKFATADMVISYALGLDVYYDSKEEDIPIPEQTEMDKKREEIKLKELEEHVSGYVQLEVSHGGPEVEVTNVEFKEKFTLYGDRDDWVTLTTTTNFLRPKWWTCGGMNSILNLYHYEQFDSVLDVFIFHTGLSVRMIHKPKRKK